MAKPKKEPALRPRIQSRYLDLLRRIYPAKASYPDGQLIEHHIDETTQQETLNNGDGNTDRNDQPAANAAPAEYLDDEC